MAKLVGAELRFKAVGCDALLDRHDARVVEEQIQPGVRRRDGGRERGYRRHRGEIQGDDLDRRAGHGRLDRSTRGVRLVQVPRPDDDVGAVGGKLERGGQPQASVAAGHDRRLSRLVRDVACFPAHVAPMPPSVRNPPTAERRSGRGYANYGRQRASQTAGLGESLSDGPRSTRTNPDEAVGRIVGSVGTISRPAGPNFELASRRPDSRLRRSDLVFGS